MCVRVCMCVWARAHTCVCVCEHRAQHGSLEQWRNITRTHGHTYARTRQVDRLAGDGRIRLLDNGKPERDAGDLDVVAPGWRGDGEFKGAVVGRAREDGAGDDDRVNL